MPYKCTSPHTYHLKHPHAHSLTLAKKSPYILPWLLTQKTTGKPLRFTWTPPPVGGLKSLLYQGHRLPGSLNIDADEADNHKTGWNSLKWCSRAKRDGLSPESQRIPQLALDAIGRTVKSEEHFWDEPLSDLTHPYIHSHFPIQISLPWNTGDAKDHGPAACSVIPQGQGLDMPPRPSPSSHTKPFSPSANSLSPGVSSTRRLWRRAELTSPPWLQQPLWHPPSIPMHYPPFPSVTNVAIPIPPTNFHLRDKSVMSAVAATTIPPFANARRC